MKLKLVSLLIGIILTFQGFSQFQWTWTPMADMPMRTANNAVAAYNSLTGQSYLYSFGGIDSTKTAAGIHQRVFAMSFLSNSWSELAQIPDTMGKIAMSANYVKGKIYLIGGYHVLANGNEISSDKVHVFDPGLNVFEADAAPIPVPIDDQVQCVYKDSLIFVVTGWSQNTNKPDVQIFDPTLNQWSAGTSTPNNNFYKAFGASGYIVGDTLYYFGGTTSGFSFTAKDFMRKGYINPNDPTDITWSMMDPAPGGAGYRTACSASGQTVFWVGGSSTSYNFDGIAYDGSGGVEPETRILHLNSPTNNYQNNNSEPYGVMDLRGIGELGSNRWLICGGMDSSQVVSNRTFLLMNPTLSVNENIKQIDLNVYYSELGIDIKSEKPIDFILYSTDGKVVAIKKNCSHWTLLNDEFRKGIYILQSEFGSKKITLQ